jgi:hypothetical protein
LNADVLDKKSSFTPLRDVSIALVSTKGCKFFLN